MAFGLIRGMLYLLSVLTGCAALPWPTPSRPAGVPLRDLQGWLDLRGVVHVHTDVSHDSPGTIEAVMRGAAAAGIAWVALTEHTRPGTRAVQSHENGVTVVPGYEVNAAGASILAIGVAERPPRLADAVEIVRWIHDLGGVAFVGHFEASRLADPRAYRRASPDGIELMNLDAMARERALSLGLGLVSLPAPIALRTLLRTPHVNLARWKALPDARTIVGGVDAHAKFRLLGCLGGTVDRYRDLFRLLTTHVLARNTSTAAIIEALRAGRTYMALEGLGAVDAFLFKASGERYLVRAPRVARLVLVCDGVEADVEVADAALLDPQAGARRCRAEAWLGNRLWIVTSYQDSRAAEHPIGPAQDTPSEIGEKTTAK